MFYLYVVEKIRYKVLYFYFPLKTNKYINCDKNGLINVM